MNFRRLFQPVRGANQVRPGGYPCAPAPFSRPGGRRSPSPPAPATIARPPAVWKDGKNGYRGPEPAARRSRRDAEGASRRLPGPYLSPAAANLLRHAAARIYRIAGGTSSRHGAWAGPSWPGIRKIAPNPYKSGGPTRVCGGSGNPRSEPAVERRDREGRCRKRPSSIRSRSSKRRRTSSERISRRASSSSKRRRR